MRESNLGRRSFLKRGFGAAAALSTRPAAFRLPSWDELFEAERPYLEAALKAWRWIASTRTVTDHGVTWPADPSDPDSYGDTLYTHGTGVLPFALELFYSTQDEQILAEVRSGADHLIAGLDDVSGAGLYVGLGGVAFVLAETHRATGDLRYLHASDRAADLIVARATTVGSGMAWPVLDPDGDALESNDIVSGTSGGGLALLYLADVLGHSDSLSMAVRAGDRLMERARDVDEGLMWDMWPGYERELPNFSHGTAGVAYFLATLSRETGKTEYADAALQGARYLQSIATIGGGGYRIFHSRPGGEDLYYLSWCHGPVGTNRLFYRLHQLTGDQEWMDWMHMGARGIMGTGVPERRTAGFWENVSQCGGTAGLGDFFLAMQRMGGDSEYGDFVDRLNDDLMGRSTDENTGLKWTQSEHRVRPELLVAQTGFMQGAAGIGKYLLHMDSMSTARRAPEILLPDAPY